MKKYIKITAILVMICLCMGLFSDIQPTTVVAEKTADELREEILNIKNQIAELEVWRKQAAGDKNAALRRIQGIDNQIYLLQIQVDASQKLLDKIQEELDALNKELEAQQKKLDEYQELFGQRIRANYETGQISYLEVMLSAGSFSDYLTRIDLVEQIMEYDNKLIKDMQEIVDGINKNIAEVEKRKQEQQKVQDELDAQMADLESKRSELKSEVDKLAAVEYEYKLKMEQAENEANERLKELDELIKESSGGEAPGILSWPVPGHTLITDYWGTRADPFGGGGTVWHNGVDVGIPSWTPVYAMASGSVISSYYDSAVGNLVIIDHGGGLSTRYYHLNEGVVSVGDYVERGQLIAYSGNTGYYTTGPHLHFEVRKYDASVGYSVSVNPLDYTSPY